MIVKPATGWLNSDGTPQLINDSSVVLQALADNGDIYKNIQPPLTAVQASLDDLSTAQVAMADGGPSATSNRNKKRLIHVSMMRLLASYVQANCGGDLTTLQLSGFPVQKPVRSPVGPLAMPQNLTLKQGALSGSLVAKANPVFGASSYTWTLTPATPGAAAQTVQTTAANTAFQDLTPGQSYTVAVNAVGAAGPSSWSKPVSQIV